MSAKSWIDEATGSYVENANKYKNALGDEYTAQRRNLISSLYNLGLRTGGVGKGMGELGRTYNENLAGVNRDISTNQIQGTEAKAALSLQSDIDSLTRAYQNALENATKMRRGAEQQMFDTGAGNEATRLENEAKAIRGKIENKYGELQRMSITNPFVSNLVQSAPGMLSQFETASKQGEQNISSGHSIWGDISSAVLPVLTGALLPGIGSAVGDFLNKIPGIKSVSDFIGNLKTPTIPGMENVALEEMATNFLSKKKPEEYLLGKIAKAKEAQQLSELSKTHGITYTKDPKTGEVSWTAKPKIKELPVTTWSEMNKRMVSGTAALDPNSNEAKARKVPEGMHTTILNTTGGLKQIVERDVKPEEIKTPSEVRSEKSFNIMLGNKAEETQANAIKDTLDSDVTESLTTATNEQQIRADLELALNANKVTNKNVRIAVKRYFEPRIRAKFGSNPF